MAHYILDNCGFTADRKLKVIGTNPFKHDGWGQIMMARLGCQYKRGVVQ
jgi:hypothetical protein